MDEADAWWHFEQRLSRFVVALRDGEALILSDRTDDSRYVQFLSLGTAGAHAEVSAAAAGDELEGLGWQLPTKRRGKLFGSPNFTADAPANEAHRLVQMAVAVLRDHWQLPGPSALSAEKVNDAGGPPVSDLDVSDQGS